MRRHLAALLLCLLALWGAAYATRWQYPDGPYTRVHRWSGRVERFWRDSGWTPVVPVNPFQDLADEEKRRDSVAKDLADPFRDLRIDSTRRP